MNKKMAPLQLLVNSQVSLDSKYKIYRWCSWKLIADNGTDIIQITH
jgi:hypothetical protein